MKRATWLALGVVGAALTVQLSPPLAALALGAAACAGLAFVGPRNVAIAAAAFGAAAVFARAAVGMALPATASATGAEAGEGQHQAVVLSINAPSGGLQRAVIELRPPAAPDRVYAWLPRYPSIAPADVLRFKCGLEPAPNDGSGFADYLARSGIGYTCRARVMERLGADGSPLAALEGLRRWVAQHIATALPEPQAGLATAMAIGLRDLVGRDVADDFRAAGLSHVVAISGWHIALVGAVVSAALAGLSRRQRSLVVLLVIVCYSILAGASPSVLRAAVMASVVLLARESGRRGQASAALSLTCAGMLLIDPATIADVGFQLSVVATAGLLVWATPLRDRLVTRLPRRTPNWLLEALAVSLAAQAATLPLVLFHFGRLSLVAPLANLLVAPLVAPAMLLTVVALGCGVLIGAGVPAIVFAPLTLLGSVGIGAMVDIAHFSAVLPFATVDVPPPFNLAAAALSAAVLFYLSRRRRSIPLEPSQQPATHEAPAPPRSRFVVAVGLTGLCVLLVLVNGARPDGRLHVTVLDIGQGDSILLQGPNGGRMLIDTGPDPDRLMTLLGQRIPAWDRRLDLVVLTHPHEDHVAGLALLLDRYRIGEIVEPGMIGPGPGDQAYRRRLAELGRESRVVAAGDRLWLDGIEIDVEWPRRGEVPLRPVNSGTDINNVSIVLELRYGARRMLFTGDVEEQIDPYLLAEGIADRAGYGMDVLKVAHHGSGTATTDAFVAALQPRVAIVSAGWGNPYGHPSPSTVARLKESGAQLFRTDVDGSVEITTNGTDLITHAEGGRPRPATPPRTKPPGVGFCPIPPAAVAQTYNRRDGHPQPCRSRCVAARAPTERQVVQSLRRRR
ncbi:MAG: ComEC/Rec2 family competence protein, partial [Chloroflexota bacterium]